MNIIRDLRDGAVNDDVAVSTLLRKALVLASVLKNETLRAWAKQELDGYANVESLPPYRMITAVVAGDFVGRVRAHDHRLPVEQYDDSIQEQLTVVPIIDSVREIEETAKSAGEMVTYALEMSWCQMLPPLFADSQLVDIRRHVHAAKLHAIVDIVRTRLLELVLDLERKFPSVIEGESALANIDPAAAASVINVHVHGDSNVVAAGSDIAMKANFGFAAGDLPGLLRALHAVSVSETDVTALQEAVVADGNRAGEKRLGARVAQWIGTTTTKLLEDAATRAPGLIADAIMHYYNLS